MDKIEKSGNTYQGLINQISETYLEGQKQAVIAVNIHLVDTYWKVGRYIIEFEQNGQDRATYGSSLLENLSRDLALRHGKGFELVALCRIAENR